MNRRANRVVVLVVLALVCALASDEAAAQGITVTPANPTISVGQTQRFTATGASTATAVSAGVYHSCALLSDGTAQCWGQNQTGQLGNGTATNSSTPVSVVGISGAADISSGGYHSCTRFPDGTLECWGLNDVGQLGNGTTANSTTPVPVSGITNAITVSSGYIHTCALLPDGTVRCWGDNSYGELGDGTPVVPPPVRGGASTAHSSTPVMVIGITTAVAVTATTGFHTCAVLQNGTARCWGDNSSGRLGNGSTTNSSIPVVVSGISTATAMTAGYADGCVLLQGGSVRCWGLNNYGQLGNGTTADAYTSVPVAGLGGVTWTSSNSAVATIDATGLATGTGPGSTTITATSGSQSGSATLTVVGRPTLSVVRQGAGSGTVTSSPAGINCGATCSASYDSGTVVTLTATPAGDSTFTGWSGCDTVSGSTCSVTMSGSRVVTAAFAVQQFGLTVGKAGLGSGTVASSPAGINCGPTCSASYD